MGDKFSYSATIYESQARFAGFVNEFISNRSLVTRPAFSEGIVPGRGKAKGFKEDAFDYPVAEGYVSFTPNKFYNFSLDMGRILLVTDIDHLFFQMLQPHLYI